MGAVQLAMVSLNSSISIIICILTWLTTAVTEVTAFSPKIYHCVCVCVCVLHLEEAQETGRIMLDEVAVTDPHEILALA